MGGGNIGDASISISADLTNFVKSLAQAETVFRKFAEALSKLDVDLLPKGFVEGFKEATKALGDLQTSAQAISKEGNQVSSAMQRIVAGMEGLSDAQQKAAFGAENILKKWEEIAASGIRMTGLSAAGFQNVIREAETLTKVASDLERFFTQRGELPPPDIQAFIDRLREASEAARGVLGDISADEAVNLAPKLAPAEKAVRDLARAQEEAVLANERFDESLRLKNAGLPEISDADRKLQAYQSQVQQAVKVNEAFDESLRLRNIGLPEISTSEKAVQSYQAQVAQAVKENEKFDESLRLEQAGVPQLTQAEKQFQTYQATVDRAVEENVRFDESLKLEQAGVPQLSAAQKAIQTYGRLQAQAIRENEAFDKSLGRIGKSASFEQLIRSAQTFSGSLDEAIELSGLLQNKIQELRAFATRGGGQGDLARPIAQLTEAQKRLAAQFGATTQSGKGFSGFIARINNAIESANGPLAKFGLTTRDIGIILGSGFLSGGIALIARSLIELAKAAIAAFIELGKIGGEILRLQKQVEVTFGPATEGIRQFAESSAQSLGLSEQAALTLTTRLGLLYQSFGVGREQSANFSLAMVDAAAVLKRVTPGVGDLDSVLRDIEGALRGNIEQLGKYGLVVNEATLKEQALAAGIRLGTGEINAQTKALLAQRFVITSALQKLEDSRGANLETATATERLTASLADLKAEVATLIAPLFENLVENLTVLVDKLEDGVEAAQEFLKENEDLAEGLRIIASILREGIAKYLQHVANHFKLLGEVIDKAISAIKRYQDVFITTFRHVPGPLGDAARAMDKVRGAQEELEKQGVKFREGQDLSNEATARRVEEMTKEWAEEIRLREQLEETDKAIRAAVAARELDINALQRIKDAYQNLARAQEDGARDIEEAEERLRRARVDAANDAEDAQRKVVRAERDARRQIADARRKIRDTEIDNRRAVFDAEERLKEARIDGAKRVEDAEDALHKARQRRAEQILDAVISLEQALRQGDVFAERAAALALSRAKLSGEIVDAEDKKKEAAKEAAKDIERAERELARTVFDARRKMEDAQRDYERAVVDSTEKVEDAWRELERTEEEINRRLHDARKNLDDTTRRVARNVADAKKNLDRLNEEFGTTSDTLDDINEKMKLFRDQLRDAHEEAAKIRVQLPESALIPGFGEEGRQHGGSVFAGRPYLVGERGLPELFIPNTSGTVVSNDQLIRVLKQMQGGQGGSQTVNIFDTGDPEANLFMIQHRLMAGVNN